MGTICAIGMGRRRGCGAAVSACHVFAAATLAAIAAAGWALVAAAGEPAASGAGGESGVAVLTNDSYLRAFLTFRTPVLVTKEGEVKTVLDPGSRWGPPKEPKPLPEFQSPLPPPDWMKNEFDDSAWDRQRAPVEMAPEWWGGDAALHTATVNSGIYGRWKFAVEDPAKAGALALSVEYVGGVVVYVNGRELIRAHLPAGELKPETLAEKYPDDLYVLEGKMLQQPWPGKPVKAEHRAAFERRYRRLDKTAVPADFLRKGLNVLAVEIRRAPINAAVISAERFKEGAMSTKQGIWAFAGLRNIRLASSSGSGVTPAVSRPKGIQVWNVPPFETVTCFDYGEIGAEPKPVAITAVRNGVFSGRLIVSSDIPIRNLKVSASDLKSEGGGAALPASAIRIRYAEPAVPEKSWAPPHRFDGLLDAIPAEIPIAKAPLPREDYLCDPIVRTGLAPGAVASLWFTVRVPQDAAPGKYSGTATVEAEGLKPVSVPIRLVVNGWTLPDPKDFTVHHLIFTSQESVAKHYGVPLWSDKHFELMGKSLSLLAEVNSREIPINIGIDFYGLSGNGESMVRWVRQPDGSFKYDFSVFDKYLDLVAKTAGKPCPIRLNCWGELDKDGKNTIVKTVSVLDPATGKLEPMEQPPFGTEESYKFWKPVVDEALKKIADRGWLDVAAFGHNSYCYPPKPQMVDVAKKLWPEGVWAYTAHNGTLGGRFGGTSKDISMPVRWSVCVWTEGPLKPRGYRELLKPRPGIWCDTARNRHWDWSPLIVIRNLTEEMIMRGMDGVGDFGGDMFPVPKAGGKGVYMLGCGRGTGGPRDATHSILAPGPEGAITTERFEMLREGTQIAEAILFVERALQEKKISGELADKANRLLDERGDVFLRDWLARGWKFINLWSPAAHVERDAKLLELAGEIAAASSGR